MKELPLLFGIKKNISNTEHINIADIVQLLDWQKSDVKIFGNYAVYECSKSIAGFKYPLTLQIDKNQIKIYYDPSVQIQSTLLVLSGLIIIGGFTTSSFILGLMISVMFLAGEYFYIQTYINHLIQKIIEKTESNTDDNTSFASHDYCPACNYRLSNFTKICPECGLHFQETRKPRSVTQNTGGYKISYHYTKQKNNPDVKITPG